MATPLKADPASLSIGEVAERAGLQSSAIRYYERIGLLPSAERQSGQRRYGEDVLTLLAVIEVSKEAGFTLKEIRRLISGFGSEVPPSERWRTLAEGKLTELDSLAARIDAMRFVLRRGVECGCLRLEDCELLASATVKRGAT